MAVTIDIGEADNIHPKNKQDVGQRLALAALAVAYGKKVAFSGPVLRIHASSKATPCACDSSTSAAAWWPRAARPLKGFAIAGEDRKFVWADAKIDGDSGDRAAATR